MDEKTKILIEEYEKGKKRTIKLTLFISLIVLGAALIISALLFRTQYPMKLQNRGLLHYSYSHILLRDETNYDYFNNVKNHGVKYYIVYRNAGLYFEQETDFATYSSHASKENAQPGITNHSVIKESVDKYTFIDKYAKTYCYDEPTSVFKALFDASFSGGKIFLRFAAYIFGTALIILGAVLIKKKLKHSNCIRTRFKSDI